MSNLISWANYCSITSTISNDSNQVLIENTLIPIASNTIENYCDRLFTEQNYYEWTQSCNYFGFYYPLQYPVTKLYSASNPDILCTINNGNDINIIINNTSLSIYDPITTTNTEYLFTSYSNVSTLFTQAIIDYPTLEVTYNTNYTNVQGVKCELLMPDTKMVNTNNTDVVIYAALQQKEAKMIDQGIMLTGTTTNLPTMISSTYDAALNYNYGNPQTCIIYKAGYNPIPQDLQYVCAKVVQDMLVQSLGNQSTGMRSESIDNYSYTLQDGVSLANLVGTKYSDSLQKYRRIIYG